MILVNFAPASSFAVGTHHVLIIRACVLCLQVASEDTVLYTAQAYADKQDISEQQADTLARLVRCLHLSQFWLSAAALSGDAGKLLLRALQPQLQQQLLLKLAYTVVQCSGSWVA
jgi:hypothetical protein